MSQVLNNITSKVAREQLLNNKKVEIEVQGVSMLPLLRANDKIILQNIKALDLKKGDVVTYESHNDTWVTHRFLRCKKNGDLLCKGDNVRRLDPPVHPNKLIGKVIAYKRSSNKNGTEIKISDGKKWIYVFLRDLIPLVYRSLLLVKRMLVKII